VVKNARRPVAHDARQVAFCNARRGRKERAYARPVRRYLPMLCGEEMSWGYFRYFLTSTSERMRICWMAISFSFLSR